MVFLRVWQLPTNLNGIINNNTHKVFTTLPKGCVCNGPITDKYHISDLAGNKYVYVRYHFQDVVFVNYTKNVFMFVWWYKLQW